MDIHQKSEPPHNQDFWNTFTAAPHRIMFFAGAIQLVLPILLWSIELIGRYTSLWPPLESLIPITWAHGFIMIYGVFIFFIFGFLMTTYPRWMNGPLINKDMYVSTFSWLSIGMLSFQLGLFYQYYLSVAGLGIFLFGWAMGQWNLYLVYKAAPADNKRYETYLNSALLLGWLGCASFLVWLLTDDWSFIDLSFNAGVWLFLLPVLIIVSHRMLPFFSSCVIKDYQIPQLNWSLPLMLVTCATHFMLEINHLNKWLFTADIPLALLAWFHVFKWKFWQSFQDRLLAILHIAFLWLAIGMTLFSVQSLFLIFSGEIIFGKAPLHALTIGFVSSMLIAMASRVTLGHSGRMLVADTTTWIIFLGLQLTAILRLAADISGLENLLGIHFNVIASLAWLAAISVWFIKYAPIYLSRRIDGKSG